MNNLKNVKSITQNWYEASCVDGKIIQGELIDGIYGESMKTKTEYNKFDQSLLYKDVIDGRRRTLFLEKNRKCDNSTSYTNMSDYIEAHLSEKSTKETTQTTLKWVHIAISKAKRTLLGMHHKINGEYLQNYLDEFTYKLIRRNFKSTFERLAAVGASNYCYNCD